VTATLGASAQTATINLTAPVLVSGVVCSPTSLGQSAVSGCTVSLTQTAPTGGSTVTLASNNASLTVPASMTVAAGASTATFNATAAATIASNQSATVTATLGASSKTATINLLAPVLVSGVVCSPASLGQSAVSGCTVTLTQTAPGGGSTVTLASNNASLTVPASVTVAAGATTATFNATAAATITSNQSATVTATLGASSQAATINLLAPVLVSGVVCSPASLGQSAVSGCTVTLTQTAPAGGSTVTLASNNASLTVLASVTVAAGSATATFNATAAATISSNQTATVTATLGASSQTAAINLLAPVLVSGVVCSPTSLGQSAVSGCTVTLTQTAPVGGSTVTLASNNASLTVPASVIVAAGATTATFNATAAATIASNQSATVTATLGASAKTATINLLAPVLVSGVVCSPASLGQSAVSGCTVTLTQTAPGGGSAVTLASNNASLTVPASVTVAAGSATATFNATAVATITSNQSATVTATLGASSQAATINLLAPVLVSGVVCSPASLGQSAVSGCTVTLTQMAPTGGSNVTLASNNASLTVPASVTTAAGSTTATFNATAAATIASNQSATVTATLGASSQAATINLLAPVLVSGVVCSPTSLGQSAVSGCTVTLTQTAPAGGSNVTLASNNASLTVPASVTVAAGATTATFNATAVATIASNQSATVTATLGASSQTATINLLAPVLVSGVVCSPPSLGQSAVSGCTVTLTQTAPAGGSTVTLASNNASLTVPASEIVAAGATTATFNATAAATIASNQSATVTATLGASSKTATINLLAPVLVSGVVCSPASLGQGATSSCTVTLMLAAPAGGSTVTLASNNPSLTVPASATVTAGAITAIFSATAAATIAVNQSATVTATLGGSSQTATVSLLAPVMVSALACIPTVLGPGGLSSCSLSLTQPISAISLVHVTSCGPQTFPTSTCTIPATGSGNLIVVGWQAGGGIYTPVAISGVTDNAGNTYGEAGAALSVDAAAGSVADLWYAKNSVSGATTLTVTPGSTIANGGAVIWEFSGVDVTAPLDQTAILNSQAASATPAGAGVTTTAGADVVISLAPVAGDVTGISSGNGFINDSGLKGNGWAHLITSSPGTYAAQWNQSPAGTYAGSTAAFRAAGSVTLTSNNSLLAVPAWVTVAAGSATATFSATAAATIASNQTATVTATLVGSSQTATINLLAPVLVSGVVCSPTSLGQSAVSGCTVTLTQTAPAGGSTVTLASNNASLTVLASVTVAAGSATATFNATAAATIASNQSATVTATLGASSQAATISLVAPILVSGVVCSPTSLGQSAVSGCTVTLTQTAPAGRSTVTLASNNASLTVPASVTVAAGSATATFNATAAATIASNQSATVTATLGASSKTATINLLAPVLVSGVVCSPASLGQSTVSGCTVTLTQTAPAGGSTVTLASNNALLTVPASVTVAVGATTATFNATAAATIASTQSATVTATLGASSKTATINLLAPVLASGVVCSPASLGQNAVSGCTVTLTQTAPAGGSTVTLASNNTSLTVPGSVTVAAGATTAAFNATAAATIPSNQSATVTATIGGSSQTATVSLLAPVTVSALACIPTVLGPGGLSSCSLSLTQPISAISLVHVTSCGPQTFPTSTCTIPATGSGNLIVVGWQAGGGIYTPVAISGVTDNAGNTYGEAGAALSVDAAAGSVADLWYAKNSVSGATTLTITPGSTIANGGAVIWEFSGVDVTAPLDQTAILNSQAASAAPAGAGVTTIAGADVVISLAPVAGNVTGISSGNGFINDSGLKGNGWAHLITSSPGTYAAQWNQSPAGTYAGSTAAFRAAGSVTLTSNNSLLAVPGWVTVAAGSTTAAFSATAAALIAGNQSATVTATLGGSSKTAVVSLLTSPPAALHSIPVITLDKTGSTSQSSVNPGTTPPQSAAATRMQSISCAPGGSHRTCRIAFTAPSDSDTPDLQLASSNASIRLPATIAIQPGQTSIRFRIDEIPPASGQAATITAQVGADTLRQTVSFEPRPGPLGVPAYLYAKYGRQVTFGVTSSDPAASLTAANLPAGAVFDASSGVFQWVPDVPAHGAHRIVFSEVGPNGGSVSTGSVVEIDSGTPVVTRVINAASRSETSVCSPGAVASIEGRWLVEGTAASDSTGHSTQLSGTEVRVNGIPAPVLSVSISRVDFLCPAAMPGATLEIALQTLTDAAKPARVVSREATPGIFSLDGSGSGQGTITHSGTSLMAMIPNYQYDSRAAVPGESLTLYATGITAVREVSVVVGGVEARSPAIAAIPERAGVYRILVRVPSGLADGEVPITLQMKMADGSVVVSNEVLVATDSGP
jgi:hypothetical protein